MSLIRREHNEDNYEEDGHICTDVYCHLHRSEKLESLNSETPERQVLLPQETHTTAPTRAHIHVRLHHTRMCMPGCQARPKT